MGLHFVVVVLCMPVLFCFLLLLCVFWRGGGGRGVLTDIKM